MTTSDGSSGSGCFPWIVGGLVFLLIVGLGAKIEETTKSLEKIEGVVHAVEADAQAIKTEYLKLKADFVAIEERVKKAESFFHWKQDGAQAGPEAPNGGAENPGAGGSR